VLYAACRCSQGIIEHLAASSRPPATVEKILWVGGESAALGGAARGGFEVIHTSAEELAERYGIEAAPLLLVADPAGRLRYAGGYTQRKQGSDVRDVEIIRDLQSGGATSSLPLFGCAVSRGLQRRLDPLSRIVDALFGD